MQANFIKHMAAKTFIMPLRLTLSALEQISLAHRALPIDTVRTSTLANYADIEFGVVRHERAIVVRELPMLSHFERKLGHGLSLTGWAFHIDEACIGHDKPSVSKRFDRHLIVNKRNNAVEFIELDPAAVARSEIRPLNKR